MSLTLRQNIGRKLTIAEMDNNFLYLESISHGAAITITNGEAIDLMNTSGVIRGAYYVITNVHPGLYGSASNFTYGLDGTDIILEGLDETHFSTNGYGKFYNPNYGSFSMWDSGASYSVGNIAIFGGQVWESVTGNPGASLNQGQYDSSSFISLDENWSVIGCTNSEYYNIAWDEIEYDVTVDFITSRYEALNNNLVNNASRTFWFYCEINPIQSFKWGTPLGIGNNITNCTVIDSYFGCLNVISCTINDVSLTEYSWIYDVTALNNSSLYDIKLSNASSIYSFEMNSAVISYIEFSNNSYMYDFEMDSNSVIEYLTLNNYSYVDDFTLNNGASLYYNTLSNYSYVESFTLGVNAWIDYLDIKNDSGMNDYYLHDYTYMEYLSLNNNSSVYSFNIYANSYIIYLNLNNESSVHNFSLTGNSYLENIDLTNSSYINNFQLYNYSYFYNIDIKNDSSISGVYLCYNSGSSCYITNLEISNNSHLYDDDDTIYLEDGSYMDRIKVDNYSAITLINMSGNSTMYMRDIIVSNYSLIDNIQITSDGNYTYFSSITLINSAAHNIVLNNSQISYIDISDGSIDSLNLNNESYIQDVQIKGGGISYYNMVVETGDHIYMDSSYMESISLDQSIISGYISMTNSSSMSNLNLTNFSTIVGGYSSWGDSVMDIGEYNYNITLDNSNLNNITLNNNSRMGLGHLAFSASCIDNVSLNNFSNITGYNTFVSSTMSYFNMNNKSNFGRGNNNSDGQSNSIQLFESIVTQFDMINNAVIDGFLYMSNASMIDITLSGAPHTIDSVSPSNDYGFENTTGIIFGGGMEIYDSYIKDIEVTNGSYFTGLHDNEIYLENSSYMRCVKIDNGSIINAVYLDNSYMKNIEVLNGSYIYNIELQNNSYITFLSVNNYSFFGDYIYLSDNSYMNFIKVDNNSEIYGGDYGEYDINLYENSYMKNINVLNYSNMTGFTFDDGGVGHSYFDSITVQNNSSFYDIELYNGSYLNNINVNNNSDIDGIRLCDDSGSNSYMYNIFLNNDSHITNESGRIYIEEGGYISNVTMYNDSWISGHLELYGGSYINNVEIDNGSYFGYNINLENNSYINNISITNDSFITGYILMLSSGFDYINITNNSWINNYDDDDESFFNGSYLYNIDLSNYSKIYNEQHANSAVGQLIMNNNSKMYNNILNDGSAIEYTTLSNHSSLYENTIYNSTITKSILNDSVFDSNDINSSNISDININDSSIYNNSIYDESGIYDMILSDSEIYTMTMTSSSVIADVQMYYSDIYNNNMHDSYIISNDIKGSSIYNNYLYSSYLSDLMLSASSDIYGSHLTGSNINYCQIHSGYMHNQTMNDANISGVSLRTSGLDSNTFYSGGGLQNVDISKNSTISSCYFAAYIQNSSLESSYIGTSNLINGNGIEFLYMRDSNFESYAGTSSWVVNLDMLGSTFNFGAGNYLIPTYTNANTNTVKYQFDVSFDGSAGYGQIGNVNIPPFLIPDAGWYLEKVTVDNNSTGAALVAGTSSFLNIGNNVDTDSGLDYTRGNVYNMSGRVIVSDISNGGASGIKSTDRGNIVMLIEGGNITAGTIYVEIILKKTNGGSNND